MAEFDNGMPRLGRDENRKGRLIATTALTAATLLAVSTFATPALAQQARPGADEPSVLDDVIVTARKREERLQDVPQSIQAFSSEQIERMNLTDMDDVASLSPSIIFDKSANPEASTIAIRGLSPTRGRGNAAILVDGIDVTGAALGSAGGGMLISTRLLDVARIEVVRGPQSVEYGRSAFAGALQYVTKDPSAEPEASAGVELGSHGRYDARFAISGPIIPDVLGFRATANRWHEDGYYRERARDTLLGGGEGVGVSGSLLYTPTSALSFKARVEYFDDKYAPEAQFLIRSNSGVLNEKNNAALAAAYAAGVIGAGGYAIYAGEIPDAGVLGRPRHSPDPITNQPFRGGDRQVFRASLVSAYEADFGRFTSWTGYTHGDGRNRQDHDQDAILSGPEGNRVDIASRSNINDSTSTVEQFSQELRFASSWDFPVQMTFGGLYWKENADRMSRVVTLSCPAAAPCPQGVAERMRAVNITVDPTIRDTEHWSVYGGLEWAVSDTLKVSAEGRFSKEEESVTGSNCGLGVNRYGVRCGDPYARSPAVPPVFGPTSVLSDGVTMASVFAVPVTIETSDEFFTPRFTFEWKPRRDALLYVTAAKGVKPGGTSTLAAGAWMDSDLDGDTDELSYGKETLWSYEVGAKLDWFDGAVRTNIAVFHQDYTDKQVVSTSSTPSGYPIAIIENAGAAIVRGVEFEGQWAVTSNLRLGVGYTYLDTEYTDFYIYTDTRSGIINGKMCEPAVVGGKKLCGVDLSGSELEKAPKHSLVGSFNYTAPVPGMSGLEWLIEGDATYQSERLVDQSNDRMLKAYSLANIRFGVTADRWDLIGYVDNIFDDDTVRSADVKTGDVDRVLFTPQLTTSTQAVLATLPDPRRFGVRFNVRF
ncbi:TonB-dependent receptor [Brevundimonas faecalis]|uniref:Iron complex outermembrane receptor protein n=1 Tax=Brevundimonas faecalis TaxID=947378 RepID=A0ABV2R9V0_9CAUL